MNGCPVEVVRELVDRIPASITVSFTPLEGVVARLDTSGATWVLLLDSRSPVPDLCWALRDVLDVLRRGPQAAQYGRVAPPLHLVPSPRQSDEDAPSGTYVLPRDPHEER